MKAKWMKDELVDVSAGILRRDGPMKIPELINRIMKERPPGYSGHTYSMVSPSILSSILRRYGGKTQPSVKFMKMRAESNMWYVDGDSRINEHSQNSAARRIKRNPNQCIIDSIEAMLNWYRDPREEWDD